LLEQQPLPPFSFEAGFCIIEHLIPTPDPGVANKSLFRLLPATGAGRAILRSGSTAAAPDLVIGGFTYRTRQKGGGNQFFQIITPAIGTLDVVLLSRQLQSLKCFSTVAALVLKNRHFNNPPFR
jgi:hypothetical protein